MSPDPPPQNQRSDRSSRTKSLLWVLSQPSDAQRVIDALSTQYTVERLDDANALLERLGQNDRPDALVLDWEPAGRETARAVRKRHDASSLPMLALTAAPASSDAMVEAIVSVASDFLPRPFQDAELRARVGALLHLRSLHQRAARAEQERAELLDAQHEESVVRERFTAILGHDIRSPLGAMLMGNKLLRPKSEEDAESTHLLDIQLRSCRRLERMALGLLEVTRSRQTQGIVLSRGLVDLHTLCQSVVQDAQSTHPTRRIALSVEGDGRGEWDSTRVEQVVANLVSNAILYSAQSASVDVACRDDGSAVRLSVHNQGSLIPDRERATLFAPFRRGYVKPTARGPKGLGLGLYLVDQIARAHGATVSVESSELEGTTFSVRWPREQSHAPHDG